MISGTSWIRYETQKPLTLITLAEYTKKVIFNLIYASIKFDFRD